MTEVFASSPNPSTVGSQSPKVAPKLPPRTYKKSLSSDSAPNIRRPPTIVDETEYSSQQLISEKALPQMVTVTSGYDGATPENCVSVGEEFVVSFAKSTKVIPAKLVGGTEEIHIPADSMLSLGLVRKGGTKTYSTVKDLLKLQVLPVVVAVNQGFTSKGYHVEKGSVLYITGRDGKSTLFCQHDSGGKNLTLTPDVVGKFSTNPEDATIYIADYTALYNAYPITVVLLQKGVDVDEHLEQYIRQTFVLEEPIDKLSLLATTDANGTKVEDPSVVEIPMDIPLFFKCIERSELDMEKVYRPAIDLCKEFDSSKVDVSYGTRVVTENDYAEIREIVGDDEVEDYYVTFDIICPNPRNETMKRALQKSKSKNQIKPNKEAPTVQKSKKQGAHFKNSDKKSHDATIMSEQSLSTSEKSINKPVADEGLAHQLAAEKDRVYQLTADNKRLTDEAETLKFQLRYSEQNCANLEAELSRVKKNVSKMNTQLDQLTQLQLNAANTATTGSDQNQEKLRKMSMVDITRLLKCMGYEMYEKNFMSEQVDGMLLSTLEEEHLKELGIKNVLHCRRFMNIIQGKESVDKYFN